MKSVQPAIDLDSYRISLVSQESQFWRLEDETSDMAIKPNTPQWNFVLDQVREKFLCSMNDLECIVTTKN